MKTFPASRLSVGIICCVLVMCSHLVWAQQVICPPDAAGGSVAFSGSVPFSISWKNKLSSGQKLIPVVVHLIGASTSLTTAQVQTAINELNTDFNSPNLDWDIEFRLAKFDPSGRCTEGITRHPNLLPNASNLKTSTAWPNKNYLNVWVVEVANNDPEILVFVSARPTLFQDINVTILRTDRIAGQNAAFDQEDGVVMKKDVFYPNNANLHVFAHEVGHWLNLLHPFSPCNDLGGPFTFWNCCHPVSENATNGDFIEDTPSQQLFATFNPVDCGNPSNGNCQNGQTPDLTNFMGYAYPCQSSFTQGQREWMFACLMLNRPDLWTPENLRCTGMSAAGTNITGNIIWNLTTVPTGYVTVTGTLSVKSGGTLTISPEITVQFCENAKVVVEPNGHLVLYGTLTSACNGRMWQGVEVQGNAQSNTQYSIDLF